VIQILFQSGDLKNFGASSPFFLFAKHQAAEEKAWLKALFVVKILIRLYNVK
jgi:hypothetical protein